jgi:GNAT superfamily N-acetyltransferase
MHGEMEISIRRAEPTDASALTDIAMAAKRHWDYPEEWLTLWRSELTATPAFIQTHPVYCALVATRLAAFYSLTESDGIWSFDDFWVCPKHMGMGIGRRLFNHATDVIRSEGGKTLRIESDPNAEGFYIKMGAHRIGHVPSQPEGRRLPLLEAAIGERTSNQEIHGTQ